MSGLKKKSLLQSTNLLNNVILSKVFFWFLPQYLEAYYKCASAPYIRSCCYIIGKEKQTKKKTQQVASLKDQVRIWSYIPLLSFSLQYSRKIEALFLLVAHLCTILFIYSDSYQVWLQINPCKCINGQNLYVKSMFLPVKSKLCFHYT